LRRIAAKLIERAEEGDLAAIREIADRLDGKPAQVIERLGEVVTGRVAGMSRGQLASRAG
jgi:ribosomal protein L17